MAELYKRLSPTGILMTYSNSALVRNTFLENKFYVGKIFNEKTGKFIGTIAAKEKRTSTCFNTTFIRIILKLLSNKLKK